jgi:hypothetical protein
MLAMRKEAKSQDVAKVGQAKMYHSFQAALIEGILEGIPTKNVNFRLGGIGLEKTRQVVEERALAGKCGNVNCKKSLEEDIRDISNMDSVCFLSNGEMVKVVDRSNYCSDECLVFFEREVLKKRPLVDVWQLHQTMLDRESEAQPQAILPSDKSELIGAVKEKTTTRPPRMTFNAEPNPDIDTARRRKGKARQEVSKSQKNVSFDEEATVIPIENRTNPRPDARYDDEDDDESFENDEEEIKSLTTLLDTSLRVEDKIEKAGLNSFATVWDFLTRVVTSETSELVCNNGFHEWEADISLDGTIIKERKVQLETYLVEGALGCDFTDSQEFRTNATNAMKQLAQTVDVSRPVPLYGIDHWILLSCIALSCFDDAGILKGYDFGQADIVKCFGSLELANVSSYEFEMLKCVLKSKVSE